MAIIVGSLALIPMIGASFMPSSDQGQLQVNIETQSGSSLEHMQSVTEDVNEKLAAYDDVIDVSYLTVGGGGGAGMGSSSNQATYMMQLIPASDRSQTTDDVVQSMSEDLESVPGADISVISTDSAAGLGNPIQISLNGPEHEVLRELADEVVDAIS